MKDCANPRRISIRRMKKKKKKESFIHKNEFYYLKHLGLQIFCRELIMA